MLRMVESVRKLLPSAEPAQSVVFDRQIADQPLLSWSRDFIGAVEATARGFVMLRLSGPPLFTLAGGASSASMCIPSLSPSCPFPRRSRVGPDLRQALVGPDQFVNRDVGNNKAMRSIAVIGKLS
jgi:hypothetical protein